MMSSTSCSCCCCCCGCFFCSSDRYDLCIHSAYLSKRTCCFTVLPICDLCVLTYHSTVLFKPSSKVKRGFHPSSCAALELSSARLKAPTGIFVSNLNFAGFQPIILQIISTVSII